MPETLERRFQAVNTAMDRTAERAAVLASELTVDVDRVKLINVYNEIRFIAVAIEVASSTPGIGPYAQEQWFGTAEDFIAKAQAIEAAAIDVVTWMEENFPTYGSNLTIAMNALGVSGAQQDTIRAQIGADLDYLLVQKMSAGAVVSPTIPAAQLAPLVTLLGALQSAATI